MSRLTRLDSCRRGEVIKEEKEIGDMRIFEQDQDDKAEEANCLGSIDKALRKQRDQAEQGLRPIGA